MNTLSKASKWLYLTHECSNSKLGDLGFVLRNSCVFCAILKWGEILLKYANRSMQN
jgi:hypothetical protein